MPRQPAARRTIEADTYQIAAEDRVAITAVRRSSRGIERHKASAYSP